LYEAWKAWLYGKVGAEKLDFNPKRCLFLRANMLATMIFLVNMQARCYNDLARYPIWDCSIVESPKKGVVACFGKRRKK